MAPGALIQETAIVDHVSTRKASKETHVAMRTGANTEYNKNCAHQFSAIRLALQLLPTYSQVPFISIADYGCSQGLNSVNPLSQVLSTLPAGASAHVNFVDTPLNDWNLFATTIAKHLSTLSNNDTINFFPHMVPRSFYHQVVPDASVDFGLAATSFHYLLKETPPVPMYIVEACDSTKFRDSRHAANAIAAHRDLTTLLRLRAREIKPNGTLVAIFVGKDRAVNPDYRCLIESMLRTVGDLLAEERLTEAQASTILTFQYQERTLDDVLAGVADVPEWEVEHCEEVRTTHPSYFQLQEVKKAALPGSEESEAASRLYAETVVRWWWAIHAPYVYGAMKLGQVEAEVDEKESLRRNTAGEEMLREMERRMVEDILERFRDEPVVNPNVYLKLRRRF